MLTGVLYTHVYFISACVSAYIHSVGFCIAYSDIWVFLGPQWADKQKGNPRFLMSDKEDQLPISHHNNDPANARELLRWDFLFYNHAKGMLHSAKHIDT